MKLLRTIVGRNRDREPSRPLPQFSDSEIASGIWFEKLLDPDKFVEKEEEVEAEMPQLADGDPLSSLENIAGGLTHTGADNDPFFVEANAFAEPVPPKSPPKG